MSTTHTPGPWRDDEGRSRVLAPSGAAVALVNILAADSSEQHEANSRLIAGAPELLRCAVMALEELQEAVRVNPLAAVAFRALEAAIEAATPPP
jgi:hypothetical protein